VLGLNLLGDGIREATDPTLSHRRGAAREARTHVPEVIA
jgi:peptide/nickel transport system permease protein